MHRFFINTGLIHGSKAVITGPDVNHIRNVLRMSPGELVILLDGSGQEYLCKIEQLDLKEICLAIMETQSVSSELPSRIYLFQGLPKNDKMEWIIQKAVELGVYQVIPVMTRRTVVKLDAGKEEKRRMRWQQIAESAAKQSGRGRIPEIGCIIDLQKAVEYAADLDVRLIPYEDEHDMKRTRSLLSQIKAGESIGIFIGPEGGFEQEEITFAQESGVEPVTLGTRILRTETAGLAMLSVLMFALSE